MCFFFVLVHEKMRVESVVMLDHFLKLG